MVNCKYLTQSRKGFGKPAKFGFGSVQIFRASEFVLRISLSPVPVLRSPFSTASPFHSHTILRKCRMTRQCNHAKIWKNMCFRLCVLLKRSPSYEHKLLILLGVLRSILIYANTLCAIADTEARFLGFLN